ncbi:MAG: S8 family serine peptidase [candidate division WOR-3 bacterium]
MPSLKEIMMNTSPEEKIGVLVHLVEKPDYESMKSLSPKEYVESLKRFSEESQRDIINYLKTNFSNKISDLKPYWIFNGFYVKATKDVIEELAKREDVEYIIEDFIIKIEEAIPGEEVEPNAIEWNVLRVRADSCWNIGYTGEGAIIGQMDTGVDVNHPALAGKWLSPYWYDPVNNQPNPYDDNGHGTHTMGTILGGDGNGPFTNDIGVAPGAKFVMCKICNSGGSCPATAIHLGFQKIADWKGSGVNIIACSNSWGSTNTLSTEFWQDCMNWRNVGVIPVFANGNSGPAPGTAGTPGNFPIVIGVGATAQGDSIASFSSRGPAPNQSPWNNQQYWPRPDWNLIKPNISAPGKNVRSSVPGGGYAVYSGTSMATPHVAGAIAIFFQKNQQIDFTTVYNVILDYADRPSQYGPYPNNNHGWGILNVYQSLLQLPGANVPYVIVSKTPFTDQNNNGMWDPGETIYLTVQVKNTGGAPIDSVKGILRFTSPYVTLLSDSVFYHGYLGIGDTSNSTPFVLKAAQNTPAGHQVVFTYHITGSGGYVADRQFTKTIGMAPGTIIIIKPAPGVGTSALVYGLAYDPDRNRLYMTEFYGSTIYILHPDELTLIGSFAAPADSCTDITYGGGYIWLHELPLKRIYKINPDNGQVIQTLNSPATTYPTGIAYDPTNGNLWCADRDQNKIYQFNPNTGQIISQFNVPYSTLYGPRCLAFEPNGPNGGSLLHVATFWTSSSQLDSSVLMEINRNTGQIVPGHRIKLDNLGLTNCRAVEFDPRPWNGYYTYWISESNYTTYQDTIAKIIGFYAALKKEEREFSREQYNLRIVYDKDFLPKLIISIPEKQKLLFNLMNVSGQVLMEKEKEFEEGVYEIPVNLKKPGIYFIHLKGKEGEKKAKIVFVK